MLLKDCSTNGHSCVREFKSREDAQPQNYNVISGFIRNLVLNTLILIDAVAIRRLEWYTMHTQVSFCYQN